MLIYDLRYRSKFIGFDNPHHNNGNNGFGMESTLNNLNGMTNIPASVANNMMMGVPSLPSLTQSNTLPSAPSESISSSAGKNLLRVLLSKVEKPNINK